MVISSFMGRDYQASSDNTPRSNPLTLPFSLAAEAAHKTHEETQVPLVWASGPATVASSGNARREPTLPPHGVSRFVQGTLSHRCLWSPEEARPGVKGFISLGN